MKILTVVSVPFFHTQGTAFSSLDRALTLRDLGYQVDIVTYPKGEDISISGIQIYRGQDIPWLTNRPWRRGPTWYKVLLTLCLIPTVVKLLRKNEYDVLHAHEDSAYFSAFLKPISDIPFVYDMHSSLPEQLEAFNMKKKIIIGILNWLERFTIKKADVVMVICRHLYDKIKAVDPDKPVFLAENLPITTLRNDEIFHCTLTPAEIRAEYKLDHHPVILYTGSLGKNQGIDLLIDSAELVAKKHPAARFLIVGGEDSEIQKYRQYVQDRGLTPYVLFTGARSPAQMDAFMTMCDCLVSPRITGKNTPLKVYSYLQAAKPLVATRLPTHTQVMDDESSVLANPDPESYAKGILWVLNHPDEAKKIGLAGKHLLDKKYPRSEYIAQHKKMYNTLLEKYPALQKAVC